MSVVADAKVDTESNNLQSNTFAQRMADPMAEALETHDSMINTVPAMRNFNNNISSDLKKTLEAVHSV